MSTIQLNNSAYQTVIDLGGKSVEVYDATSHTITEEITRIFKRIEHSEPHHFDYHSCHLEIRRYSIRDHIAAWSEANFLHFENKLIKTLQKEGIQLRVYKDLYYDRLNKVNQTHIVAGRYCWGAQDQEQEKNELLLRIKQHSLDSKAQYYFAQMAPNDTWVKMNQVTRSYI